VAAACAAAAEGIAADIVPVESAAPLRAELSAGTSA
jgi:hypothetical protein